MKYTHIKVTEQSRDYIRSAAKRFNKSMGEFVYQCVFFVHKQKYDPYDLEDIKIVQEFIKLKDQIIRFIRTQERDHIVPMHQAVNNMQRQLIANGEIMADIVAQTADYDAPTTSKTNEKLEKAVEALEIIKKRSKPTENGLLLDITADQLQALIDKVSS